MLDLIFERNRRFPATHYSDDLVLVVPDGLVEAEAVARVQDALASGGGSPEVIPQSNFIEELYQDAHIIACGHLSNNTVVERLYTLRCCFVDTFFPGADGYFIKSISDPFGYDRNCIVVGADQNLTQALAVFEEIIETQQGDLTRVHAHRFSHELPPLPDASALEEMVRSQLAIWGGGWSASPFRGGGLLQNMWHYYLTDHEVWGRAIPPVFAGSIEPWRAERRDYPESYHCFFNLHSFIHLWDLIEDSPLYTEEDRRNVVTLFGELLHHLAGLFYLKPEVNPPGEPRQNHSTFIGLDLAAGHDYLVKRYGIRTFEPTVEAVERIFGGQADSYKPNDDAGVGYAWHVPQETLYYMLYKNDYRYIDDGPVADLCRLAIMTVDNMRSEVGYGDAAGYTAYTPDGWNGHLWPLMVSTWRNRNSQSLWALNRLGEGKRPTLGQALSGLYAAVEFTPEGFTLEGVAPEPPQDLLGVSIMPFPPSALQWVRNHTPEPHRPDPARTYFDKVSFRDGFESDDEYLLLEGVGTFCHGHEDTNAILRLTWNNRAWLADGDYIRAAPKFHNAVTVIRDGMGVLESPGEGVVIPPLASVTARYDGPGLSLLQTEAPGYNGVDWRRNIFWGKGRYFVVIDQLRCVTAGEYHGRCLWRLVGETEQDGARTRLSQQGESFFIHNADGARQEIVPDLYAGGDWTNYPYADKRIHVLHQTTRRHLETGEDLIFLNLLTPHEDVRIERLSDHTVKITDGAAITVLGVGHATLGAAAIEAALFAVSLTDGALTVQGVRRMGLTVGEDMVREDFNEEYRVLDLESSALARHLRTVLTVQGHRPAQHRHPLFPYPEGGLRYAWKRDITEADIQDVDLSDGRIVVGTEDGQVIRMSLEDGHELWRRTVGQPVSAVLLADVDGAARTLVGTADSQLIALDGNGQELWRRELRNISNREERVVEIVTANLDGSGHTCILAGTAGWYVNAVTTDGDPLWANWVRYHPITALAATDVDGDGHAEVIVGNIYSTPLSVHNHDGSFRWSTLEQVGAEGNATTPRRGIHLTRLLLLDVDGDGTREIVYGTADGWIYAVRPQDGAEAWRLNIVGEVTGLVATPSGIAAASEYGYLYGIDHDGGICWRHHAAQWIHAMVSSGDRLIIAADGLRLLSCNPNGACDGALTLDSPVRGLWPCDGGAVCSLKGGGVARVIIQ